MTQNCLARRRGKATLLEFRQPSPLRCVPSFLKIDHLVPVPGSSKTAGTTPLGAELLAPSQAQVASHLAAHSFLCVSVCMCVSAEASSCRAHVQSWRTLLAC